MLTWDGTIESILVHYVLALDDPAENRLQVLMNSKEGGVSCGTREQTAAKATV